MKILHVEDFKVFIGGAQKLFSGYDYKFATSAEEALEILKDLSFDVIICDGNLAGKMTGWELVRVLRANGLKTSIIACSNGYNDDIMKAGANIVVDKNFMKHEFEFIWLPAFEELGLV